MNFGSKVIEQIGFVMFWMIRHQHKWRAVILASMIIAFSGPWIFDSIAVPSEYECEFRLHDNICGIPLSGLEVYVWFFVGSFSALLGGLSESTETVRLIIMILILSCPLLPLFNTVFLVLKESYHPPRILTLTAWFLAVGAGVFFEINSYPTQFWALWGLWFFVGVSIIALGLEILFFTVNKKRLKEF